MKQMVWGVLLAGVILAGCNAKNAEYKRWNSQGQLVEQVRMGQVNVAYWFGLRGLHVKSDPLQVSIDQVTERPDPNSINAISTGVGTGLKLITEIP